MAFEVGDARLFGLDLSSLTITLRRGWDGLRRWPWLARLVPPEPVLAHWPDGTHTPVLGVSRQPADAAAIEFHALVLPPELVLSRELELPHLTDAEIDAALQLELQAESPFPVERLDWGWRLDRVDEQGLGVTLVFAARDHVDAFVEPRRAVLPEPLEVWAEAGGPVPLRGRGGTARQARDRQRRRRLLGWSLLCLALLGLLSAAPYWQLRARTIDAQRQVERLERDSGPYLDARAALVAAEAQADAVAAWWAAQADTPMLLYKLTMALPDSASLNRFDVEGRRVRITGSAADGAGLMDSLRGDPEVAELRALSPIVRGREGLDNFYLEFHWRGPASAPGETDGG